MVQPSKRTIYDIIRDLTVCLPDDGPTFNALTEFIHALDDALKKYFTGAGWIGRKAEDEHGVIREFLQYVPRRQVVELVD